MGNSQSDEIVENGIYIDEKGVPISHEEFKKLSEDTNRDSFRKNNKPFIPKKEAQNSKSVSGCFGCIHQEKEWQQDRQELMINFEANKPKGRLTANSIAFLDQSEINFFKSSATRNVSAIRFFLKRGVNINILDEERTSPLHVASRHGSLQVVEELLNNGADCDITDIAGWTPLHVAAFFNRTAVCNLLLKFGARN